MLDFWEIFTTGEAMMPQALLKNEKFLETNDFKKCGLTYCKKIEFIHRLTR